VTREDVSKAADWQGSIDDHRQFMDRIDKTIMALICERVRLALATASPQASSLEPQAPDTCAYQGLPGAFSEDAALAFVGTHAALRPCPTLADVFEALAAGRVRRAVVPIENSLAGRVPGCAELIARHDARIIGERALPIRQALVAPAGVALDAVRRVLSHPVAIAQCGRFFRAHPALAAVPVFDTAGAVAEITRSRATDAAAIASRRAADLYGAVVLLDDIQDRPDNVTRFLLIECNDNRAAE
jgi:prephenate dehydratase